MEMLNRLNIKFNVDEVHYVFVLIVSLGVGFIIRKFHSPKTKQTAASLIGFIVTLYVCGYHMFHSLVTAFGAAVIIKTVSPRISHVVCFLWVFSYLVFFRITQWFGLPSMTGFSNAVQLILTLKLIGLSFEVHDTYLIKSKLSKDPDNRALQLLCKYEAIKPSFADIMMYSYCYICLFTGPYYKYRTYHDFLYNPTPLKLLKFSTNTVFIKKVKMVPIYAVMFIIVSNFYKIQYVGTEEFNSRSFWYKLFYMAPMFLSFRLRFYVAWSLAECSCMIAGFGAYPIISKPKPGRGPSDFEALEKLDKEELRKIDYNYDTIWNVDPYGCETKSTVREGMKTWNKSVQFWLAHIIYKRFPFKLLRTFVTMSVSAFWHGIHPGYYLSFMMIPFALIAEDEMSKLLRPKIGSKFYDVLSWFVTLRTWEYMNMGFLLLTYEKTIAYWSTIYYIMHIWIIFCIIIGKAFGYFQ